MSAMGSVNAMQYPVGGHGALGFIPEEGEGEGYNNNNSHVSASLAGSSMLVGGGLDRGLTSVDASQGHASTAQTRAGTSIALLGGMQVSLTLRFKGLFLYTSGVLRNMEWFIR